MKIILVAAISADGFIGRDPGHLSTTWTSSSDKRLFMRLARESGTLIMGMTTLLTTAAKAPTLFTKSIPGRRLIVYTREPETVAKYPATVETTEQAPADLAKRLEAEGVKTAVLAGGASIYRQFIEASVVDELYLNVMPQLFGSGISLLGQPTDIKLRLLDSHADPDDGAVTLHYEAQA